MRVCDLNGVKLMPIGHEFRRYFIIRLPLLDRLVVRPAEGQRTNRIAVG